MPPTGAVSHTKTASAYVTTLNASVLQTHFAVSEPAWGTVLGIFERWMPFFGLP